jgi:hypothetical protein
MKLQAMRLESLCDWKNAEHLYGKLMEADEANPARHFKKEIIKKDSVNN